MSTARKLVNRPKTASRAKKAKSADVILLPTALGGGEAYRARELETPPTPPERLLIPLGLSAEDEFILALRAVLAEWYGDREGKARLELEIQPQADRHFPDDSAQIYSDASDWVHFINFEGFRLSAGRCRVYLPGPIPQDSRIAREEAELTRLAGRPQVICTMLLATDEGVTVTRRVDDLDDELEPVGIDQSTARGATAPWTIEIPKGLDALGEFDFTLKAIARDWFGVADPHNRVRYEDLEIVTKGQVDTTVEVGAEKPLVILNLLGFEVDGVVEITPQKESLSNARIMDHLAEVNRCRGVVRTVRLDVVNGNGRVTAVPAASPRVELDNLSPEHQEALFAWANAYQPATTGVLQLPADLRSADAYPESKSNPVLVEARRRLTSVSMTDRDIFAIYPRRLLRLVLDLSTDIAATTRILRGMKTHNEIGDSEFLVSFVEVVMNHVYKTWQFSPEGEAALPELDRSAQAAGVDSWLEMEERDSNGGIRDIPKLSDEQTAFAQRTRRLWDNCIYDYAARLMTEAGEEGYAAYLNTDPLGFFGLVDELSEKLRNEDEFAQLKPIPCPIRGVRVYEIQGGESPEGRVYVMASACPNGDASE